VLYRKGREKSEGPDLKEEQRAMGHKGAFEIWLYFKGGDSSSRCAPSKIRHFVHLGAKEGKVLKEKRGGGETFARTHRQSVSPRFGVT